jgi:cell division protein FtsQ
MTLTGILDWVAAPNEQPRFGVEVQPRETLAHDLNHDADFADDLDGNTSQASASRRTVTMDPRLAARREQVRAERVRRRLSARHGVAAALVVVALAAAGGYGALHSSLTEVASITVDGAETTGAVAVVQAAGVSIGDSLLNIDTAAASAKIESLDGIDEVTVVKRWPRTLKITVIERVPVAAVAMDSRGIGGVSAGREAWLLVDRSGTVLREVTDPPRLPRISSSVVAGRRVGPQQISADAKAAVALVAAMPKRALNRLDAISGSAGVVTGEVVIDRRRIVVEFGRPVDVEAKGKALLAVLDRADLDRLERIDVTVPDIPVLSRRQLPVSVAAD